MRFTCLAATVTAPEPAAAQELGGRPQTTQKRLKQQGTPQNLLIRIMMYMYSRFAGMISYHYPLVLTLYYSSELELD